MKVKRIPDYFKEQETLDQIEALLQEKAASGEDQNDTIDLEKNLYEPVSER